MTEQERGFAVTLTDKPKTERLVKEQVNIALHFAVHYQLDKEEMLGLSQEENLLFVYYFARYHLNKSSKETALVASLPNTRSLADIPIVGIFAQKRIEKDRLNQITAEVMSQATSSLEEKYRNDNPDERSLRRMRDIQRAANTLSSAYLDLKNYQNGHDLIREQIRKISLTSVSS